MSRPTLYLHVHKGLRLALSSIQLRSGATSHDDEPNIVALAAEIRELIVMFRSHAKNEEQNIHPLLEKINAPAHELWEAHKDVEARLDKLLELTDQVVATPASSPERAGLMLGLYRYITAFNAFYIEHMIDEEGRFLPLVMESFSPDEVLATRRRIHGGITLEHMVYFVRWQLPASLPKDRVEIMMHNKHRFEPHEFNLLCGEAEAVLTPDQWEHLKQNCPAVAEARPTPQDAGIEALLGWWFGEGADDTAKTFATRVPMWMAPPLPENRAAIDIQIRRRYGADFKRAVEGRLDPWAESPRGRLALVLLLDQFSRNLYRDDARAFETDPTTQRLTLEGIERGHDKELRRIERMFFYMPLMHSETLDLQKRSVEAYTQLAADGSEGAERAILEKLVGKAKEHIVCIERFGRYPHRNKVLGRTTTPEEQTFLDNEPQPGRGSPGRFPVELLIGQGKV